MHPRSGLPAREAAETLALEAFAWIAAEEGRLARFLALSGAAPADLRARAADPEFLGFVLDFLLADEALLTAFAAEAGLAPEAPARARAALPGGDLPSWT